MTPREIPRFRSFIPWLVAAGMACCAWWARAETPLELAWVAPPGCPDAASVRSAVAGLLEGSSATGSSVVARGTVTVRGAEWALDLTITREGTTAHRTMSAASCPAVAEAASLILALTIDPVHANLAPAPAAAASGTRPPAFATDAGSPDAPPPPATSASAVPPAPTAPASVLSSPPARPPAPAPPTASPARNEFALWVAGTADVGSVPGPALGFEGGVAWTHGHLRIEGFGAFWPGQTATASIPDAFGTLNAKVHLADGGLLGCYLAIKTQRWELAPCLALELGSLSATGSNLGTSTPASALWSAARGDLRLSLRITARFALVVGLGAAVPLHRSPFTVAGPTGSVDLFEPSAIVGRAALGPELRF